MLHIRRFIVSACALAGLLASPCVTAVPFHVLVEGDSPVEGVGAADGITFVELVGAAPGRGLADLHPLPNDLGVGTYTGLSFDSGFALDASAAGSRARRGNHSFVSGVVATRAPLLGDPALPPSANVATSPAPAAEAGGAGSFAEPASVALLGLGLAGLAYSHQRRRRRRGQAGR